MAVLCFLFPIVGWILWAVKKSTEPDEAYNCAKWAWIGFAVNCFIILLAALG